MTAMTPLRDAEVLKKGAIYVLSSGVSQAVMLASWLALPWALSATEIGQFALLSFGIDLMTRFILVGMDSAMIRFLVEDERRSEILVAVHVWLVLAAAAVATVVWSTRHVVPRLVTALAPLYADALWLAFGAAVAAALATVAFTYHVATGAATRYARLTVLRSVLIGIGYLAAAFAGLGVRGLVAVQLGAGLTIAATFYFAGRGSNWSRPDRTALREVGAYGLPMTVYSAVALVSDYLGRLIIGWKVSIDALGVFQFFYQIVTQVNGLWSSLNRAWTPHVFQLLAKSRELAFEHIKRGLVFGSALYAGGVVLCMGAGLAGFWGVVLAPSVAGRLELLYLLLLGPLYTAIYTAFYPAFYYQKNTVRISVVQSLVSAGTMAATVVLTVQFASVGAALAWVAGIFVTPIAYFVGFPRLQPELRPIGAAVAIWGLGGTLAVVAILEVGSTILAALALVASCAAVLVWRAGTDSTQPVTA